MNRFETLEKNKKEHEIKDDVIEPTPILHRRRLKARKILSVSDKISIAYKVLIEHEY